MFREDIKSEVVKIKQANLYSSRVFVWAEISEIR